MNARQETRLIEDRILARGIGGLSFDTVNILRRAEKTLHRWAEQECGDGDNYKSWAIERDEVTNKPFMCIYPHQGEMRKYRIADREKGALDRVARLCKAQGVYFYHQTDPRGCQLYISNEPLTDQNYTNGVAVCI